MIYIVRESWNPDLALRMLKDWIVNGKWEGTTHFRKHNSSLYEYLYRTMGLDEAFDRLGLDYQDFKKSKGKRKIKRDDDEVIEELKHIIQNGKWKGIRYLQENNSLLYRDLSRIGFHKAFKKLGLDYKDYRYAIWTREEILQELEQVLKNGEWQGSLHLKETNSRLYNAIVRHIGFEEAFQALGLNYEDFKHTKHPVSNNNLITARK